MGANAQTSVPAFTAGQVLTAAQMTQVNTGIPVFADSTARDAAFGGTGEKTLAEGQMAYLEDTNATQYYDGSSWAAVAGGKILQVVTGTYSTQTSTTSATYVNTSLTATITPSATTSKIMVFASVPIGATKTGLNTGEAYFAVERGGSQLAENYFRYVDDQSSVSREIYAQGTVSVLDSPATTSATTYTWQMKSGLSATVYSFYNNFIGTLTLMEVSA